MRALPIAVLLGILVPATPSLGWDNDTKAYAGTFCRASTGMLNFYWTHAYNGSGSSWMIAECPIVNDEEDGINWAKVHVIDQHYSSNVRCSMASVSTITSSIYGWFETRSSTGTSYVPQMIKFGSLNHFEGTGVYNLGCLLPPRYSGNASKITGYIVEED